MEELHPETGIRLLHRWGLPEWDDHGIPVKYFLWDRCCVFAIMENEEGGIDGHMAMDPPKRRRSREACRAFLDHWGHLPIRVPVLGTHSNARNVVRKVGFREYPPERVRLASGEVAEVIFLRRPAYGWRD